MKITHIRLASEMSGPIQDGASMDVVEEKMHNNANINKETPKTESWMLKLGAHIFKRPLAN